MTKYVYPCDALTGGADGALDAIPSASCETGSGAVVFVSGTGAYHYVYNETESGAESSPDIIIPDDNSSGTGAWLLQNMCADTLNPSNGIYLGGTAAANLLDDYEEGTFTPLLEGGTDAGSHSYSQQTGMYIKIGRLVFGEMRLSLSSKDSGASGVLHIAGLPFISETYGGGQSIGEFSGLTLPEGMSFLGARIRTGHTSPSFSLDASGSDVAVSSLNMSDIDDNFRIYLTFSYYTT